MVKISDSIMVFLQNYLAQRGLTLENKDEYLFVAHSTNGFDGQPLSGQSIYEIIKAIAEKAGLDSADISPHCLRHTFITEALDKLPIEVVKDLVGHKDINTTKRYDHTKRILEQNPADDLALKFMQKGGLQ